MSTASEQWRPPGQPNPGASSSPPHIAYGNGAPLGGSVPVPEPVKKVVDRRDLYLTAVLLISAIAAGWSSLMPWRDYAWQYSERIVETGWVRPDGGAGRGWITIGLSILIAFGGVLVATGRIRTGRVLALTSGIGLMTAAVIEWGIGDGGSRNGPGMGLWVELLVGAVVVLAIGILEPSGTPRRKASD